jgi:hypothetical protein
MPAPTADTRQGFGSAFSFAQPVCLGVGFEGRLGLEPVDAMCKSGRNFSHLEKDSVLTPGSHSTGQVNMTLTGA